MIEKYEHHKMKVAVVDKYKGKHRDICVCWQGCPKFKPGEKDHCPIAQRAFDLSKKFGLILVMECKEYP